MRWLITGGAGFIGTNLSAHLMEQEVEVVVLDDLSRDGSQLNASFLADNYGLEVAKVDVADEKALNEFLDSYGAFDAVAHLAGQVSLLESIARPRHDFLVNAYGTLNLLEWIRTDSPDTVLIGMSSNKIYGDLHSVRTVEDERRYVAPDWPLGFDESLPLDLHGPYGCSKGVADQYLADYARTYGLRTASLRQSSVYGPHQHPRSDQGWVAHMVEEASGGRTIRLNGVGMQVRDLLHARDLARLFPALARSLTPGKPLQANVGGGPSNAISILELFDWIESFTGQEVSYETGPERPSDQKVFVSDNSRVTAVTGWSPQTELNEGLSELMASATDKAGKE